MTDLQSAFYIVGIVYMVLNVLILIVIGVGIIFIFKTVSDIRKKIEEKIKFVEDVIKHPEDVIADIGASLIRKSFNRMKQAISRKKTPNE